MFHHFSIIIIHYENTSIQGLACTVSETNQWHKCCNHTSRNMFDPCSYDDLLPGDELSFALGKEGATRRKLANASGLDAQPTAKIKLFERIYMAFAFCTDSPSSCFWRFEISSNSPPIHISSSHPCSSPSSIGQAASWNILAKSPLWLETDLNVSVHGTARPEAHCNVFIISYHFIPGVHSSKEAVQEKSFFHPTQNVFSFRNYIWNGRYSYNRLPRVEQQSLGRTTLLGWSSNALVQSLSTFRAAAMA